MILVTGGSGHLGANLVRRLIDDGHRVRALVRRGANNRALDGLDLEVVEGDLRDPEACARAMRGVTHVHHCAAKVSTADAEHREIYECNVLGTRNLLRAAREAGVQRVVVTGSFSAVGHLDGQPSDEGVPFNPFDRHMPYETSKAFAEHECLKAFADGLDVVIATSCAIVGPHDYKPSRLGRALRDFANGRLRAYIPGGFEFVAARDMVQGHLLAMDRGRPGQKYIFSSGFLTVDELVGIWEAVTGRPRPRLRLPPPLMAGLAEASSFFMNRFFPDRPQRFTPGAVRILRLHRRADTTKARRELGFSPTPIADAVREAYEWMVGQGWIEGRRAMRAAS